MKRRINGDTKFTVLVTVVIALIVFLILVQMGAASDCAERGGEFLRNWVGWPVCVGATS